MYESAAPGPVLSGVRVGTSGGQPVTRTEISQPEPQPQPAQFASRTRHCHLSYQ